MSLLKKSILLVLFFVVSFVSVSYSTHAFVFRDDGHSDALLQDDYYCNRTIQFYISDEIPNTMPLISPGLFAHVVRSGVDLWEGRLDNPDLFEEVSEPGKGVVEIQMVDNGTQEFLEFLDALYEKDYEPWISVNYVVGATFSEIIKRKRNDWIEIYTYYDLYHTAAHEVGHLLLGSYHNFDEINSVMSTYSFVPDDWEITDTDVAYYDFLCSSR